MNSNLKFPTLVLGIASALFSCGAVAAGGGTHGQSAMHAQSSMRAQSSMSGASAAGGQSTGSDSRSTRTTTAPTTTHATGQPNASCEDTPNYPGNSSSAPGSAFNPEGRAGEVYAGEQPQDSRNPNSVSQYDVACARPTH